MSLLSQLFLVGLGGAFGSISRFLVGLFALKRLGPRFPYGTCFVNITGCFLIGFLAAYFAARALPNAQQIRLILMTGFLGGYTTFSTYALDTHMLTSEGDWELALINFLGSAIVGFIALRLGIVLAKAV